MLDAEKISNYICDRFYVVKYNNIEIVRGLLLNYNSGNIVLLAENGIYHIKFKDIDFMKPIMMKVGLDNFSKEYQELVKSLNNSANEEENKECCGWLITVTKDKYYYKCSKCGHQFAAIRQTTGITYGEEYKHITPYCSHCGRKMMYTEHES